VTNAATALSEGLTNEMTNLNAKCLMITISGQTILRLQGIALVILNIHKEGIVVLTSKCQHTSGTSVTEGIHNKWSE